MDAGLSFVIASTTEKLQRMTMELIACASTSPSTYFEVSTVECSRRQCFILQNVSGDNELCIGAHWMEERKLVGVAKPMTQSDGEETVATRELKSVDIEIP